MKNKVGVCKTFYRLSRAAMPLLHLKDACQKMNPVLYEKEFKAKKISKTVEMLL